MLSFVYPKLSKLKLHQDSPSAARVINQAIVVEQQLTCEYRKMFILILLAALLIPLTWHYTSLPGPVPDGIMSKSVIDARPLQTLCTFIMRAGSVVILVLTIIRQTICNNTLYDLNCTYNDLYRKYKDYV